MTLAIQQARDAAVAAFVAAHGFDSEAYILSAAFETWQVVDMVTAVSRWAMGPNGSALDLAALHALALLLAALTAPAPATCAPGCVRLAAEGPGHPGACRVPETGGGR